MHGFESFGGRAGMHDSVDVPITFKQKHINYFLIEIAFLIHEQIFYIFTCLFSAYFYGFIACKSDISESKELVAFSYFLEVFFLCTMGLEFITMYENPRVKGTYIKELKPIALRYLRGNFLRDVIPILPLQLYTL